MDDALISDYRLFHGGTSFDIKQIGESRTSSLQMLCAKRRELAQPGELIFWNRLKEEKLARSPESRYIFNPVTLEWPYHRARIAVLRANGHDL